MYKFLHAADIHLDSPLRGLGKSDDLPADEIRGATRRALDNLVRLAIDEAVKFVLIAGDVYDGDWKDQNTGLWFVGRMARLRDAGIKVFLIRGNHDAQNKMTATLPLPDNVHQFRTDCAGSETLADLDVVIHGQGFARAAVEDDLAANYPTAKRSLLNIWMLHTSAGGVSTEHARYAPCTLDGLRAKGYGYWALGHIHKRETLCETDAWVAFPGNAQGRHIREAGAKGCLLVTVDDHREVVSAEFRALDVLRWETCRVDATGLDVGDDLYPRFEAAAKALLAGSDDRPLAVRVEIAGVCSAHNALAAWLPKVIADLRSTALGLGGGRFWIEKVKLGTSPETADGLDEPGDHAMGVLLETIDECRRDPEALKRLARADLDELRDRLAPERDGFDGLDLDSPAWLAAALDQARPLLLARLRAGPS